MKTIKWILIGTLFGIVFAGCYTRIVHTPVMDEAGTYYHPTKNCSDCHSSADYYYYHFPYYYDRWGAGRYWRSYYSDPWWYHDYWWWDGEDNEGLPVGAPHYYDQRERPSNVPTLVPSAGEVKTKEGEAPAVPGGSTGSEVKEKPKTESSGSQYYVPRVRPDQPKEEPKEEPKDVKKEEKKAKEKQ
jgi:hypothetical protein